MTDASGLPEPPPIEEKKAPKAERPKWLKKLLRIGAWLLGVAAVAVGALVLVTWLTVSNSDQDAALETLAGTEADLPPPKTIWPPPKTISTPCEAI